MALWTPEFITTALWLDAADADTITLNSGNVSQWDDKSGNAKHATQPTASNQPPTTLDGIDFTTSSTTTLVANEVFGNIDLQDEDITYFVVGESLNRDGSSRPWGWADRGTTPIWLYAMDATFRWNNGSASFSSSDPNAPTVYSFRKTGSIYDAWFNGSSVLSGHSHSSGAGLDDDFWIGNTNDIDCQVYVNEIVAIGSSLSDSDRQKIEGYLAWKWGLEANLPSGHPYELAAPVAPIVLSVYGTILDKDGNPAERNITLLDATGQCVATGTSDPVTGEYEIARPNTGPVTVVFSGEPDRNAIVYAGVVPGEKP